MTIYLEALEGGGWTTRVADCGDDREGCQKGTSRRSPGFSDAQAHILGYGDVQLSRRGNIPKDGEAPGLTKSCLWALNWPAGFRGVRAERRKAIMSLVPIIHRWGQ